MLKYNNIVRKKVFTVLAFFIGIAVAMLVGCAHEQSAGQMSKQGLRDQLEVFSAYAKSTLGSAINEIDRLSPSKRTQMITLQFRIKALQGLNAMLEHDDAVVAFIDTWAYSVRLRMFLEEGQGANLLNGNQGIIVDAARAMESKIAEVGKQFLTDEQFRTTEQKIKEFASLKPIQSNYSNIIAYPTEEKSERFQAFNTIIGIPMAPFTAMKGVDRTATAVNRFTDTAGRFSDIVADLPELTRWQLLLLYYELEESETVSSFVASANSISENSARLADAADKLPGELKVLVDDFDSKQANLRTTLDKIQEVSAALDTAAKSITGTARAWQQAADATTGVFTEAGKLKSEPKESSQPASIQDIQQTIDKVTAAAAELRTATAQLNQLAQSDIASKAASILVWRIIQLVALILVLMLVYKIILRKLTSSTPNKSEP